MKKIKSVLGLIVLYYPDELVFKRIDNLSNQVDFLIVYDNTDDAISFTVGKISSSKIMYVSNEKNEGIATPLEFARTYALQNDYDFLLTSDQDTNFPEDYVSSILSLKYLNDSHSIFGPIFYDRNNNRYAKFPIKKGFLPVRSLVSHMKGPVDVFCIITSGAIHRVSDLNDIGAFREDYFIDYVDNEYCLRAWSKGHKVVVCPEIVIEHALGERNLTNGLIKFSPTNYSPIRKYYMTRNRLDYYKNYIFKFPFMIAYDFLAFCLDLFRIIRYENNKSAKLKSMLQGAKDFFRGKMGPK